MARSSSVPLLFTLLVLASFGILALSREVPSELNSVKQHDEWMNEYGRVYASPEEKEMRFKIFKENLEKITAHNKVEGRMYDMSVNQFADMTIEEIQAKYMGLPADSAEKHSQGGKSSRPQELNTTTNYGDLPAKVDWRKEGAVTSIKNQERCGSCWAFSAVSAIEGIHKIKKGKLIDLSAQELVHCDQYDDGCNGGFMSTAFQWVIENGGLNSEKNYPYVAKADQDCDEKKKAVVVASITGYRNITANDEKALQAAVAKQPVSVGIAVGTGFSYYSSGIYTGKNANGEDNCGGVLNHGITVVGYDALEDGTEYWIVKNSWGAGRWGEKGYIRVARGKGVPKDGVCGMYSRHSCVPLIEDEA